MKDERDGLRRRELLQRGVVATLGACAIGFGDGAALAADTGPRVGRYRKLGRTGFEISDISIGTSRTARADVIRHAFDRGINYFDTAESYKRGEAERAIGEALHDKRDRVYIATKVVAKATDGRHKLMDRLDGSLRRLRTDYVDVYFNHAVNDVARLKNGEWYEFAERARKQGKIRFTGMSGHGGHLIECLDYAIDRNLVDVILVAYNFGQDPAFYERFTRAFDFIANQKGLPRVLANAREKGIGVIVMKTLMGGRLNDLRPYEWPGSTFAQAAVRWVLSSPYVDALVVSMMGPKMIDTFLRASGKAEVSARDRRLLKRYAQLNGATYCRPACDACAASCPYQVPIAEVLRTRMYAVDYQDRDLARSEYAALGAGATACVGCADQPCLGACPHGLDIPELTCSTARMLGAG